MSSPGAITSAAEGASIIQIESSKVLPLLVLLSVLCGASIAMGYAAFAHAQVAEREARMLQYYVLEMDAKLISAGVKRPEDSVASQLKGKRP